MHHSFIAEKGQHSEWLEITAGVGASLEKTEEKWRRAGVQVQGTRANKKRSSVPITDNGLTPALPTPTTDRPVHRGPTGEDGHQTSSASIPT